MTTAHEPRSGPGAHLSAEDLSALAEGAQPSAADAGGHLLECAACRGEVDAISELLALFEEWDAPAMPREVAIRIDAALARESAARAEALGAGAASDSAAGSATSSSPTTSESTTLGRSRRRRWFAARPLGWAVASLVLIAGGVGLALKFADTGTSSTNSASGAATSVLPEAGPNGAVAGGQGAARAPSLAAPESELAQWTKQVLASKRSLSQTYGSSASTCTSGPPVSTRQVLATTSGTYGGAASTLVIYANPADPSKVLAVVYAAPCSATNDRVLDQALVAK